MTVKRSVEWLRDLGGPLVSRRRPARYAVLACCMVAGSLGLVGCSESKLEQQTEIDERPTNVVLVVIDSLRADHLSCYGHERPTTPEIDALAAVSVRYANAFSQAPWTTPSIGSLLSSQYPTVLGIRHALSPLPEGLVLLPEVLQANGIATGAVVSHSFTSAKWGFSQGFDSFDESNIKDYEGITSPGVSARAIQFLDQHRDRPFFLFLHYFDPHFAYVDHDRFSFGAGQADYSGPVKSGQDFLPLAKQRDELDGDDVEELHRLYDSELALTDHYVGKVLEHLRALSLFDDSLIIVTADHGEEFLDHGMLGHAKTLYNELVSVPLIVKYPRGEAGVVEEPVALLDLYPTVLDVLGLEVDHALAGSSLRIDAKPGAKPNEARPVFTETSRRRELRAVVVDGYKLVLDLETGARELFHLESDSAERYDLTAAEPERVESMTALLESWMRDTGAVLVREGDLELDPAERERLRRLGYL